MNETLREVERTRMDKAAQLTKKTLEHMNSTQAAQEVDMEEEVQELPVNMKMDQSALCADNDERSQVHYSKACAELTCKEARAVDLCPFSCGECGKAYHEMNAKSHTLAAQLEMAHLKGKH